LLVQAHLAALGEGPGRLRLLHCGEQARFRAPQLNLAVERGPRIVGVARLRRRACGAGSRRLAGREITLGDLGARDGLLGGINAVIVGNYLTTLGRPPEADLALLGELRMPIRSPTRCETNMS
jgi:hypothetical protein